MFPVLFHDSAEAEAEEAISWFEEHGEELGTSLRECVEELIERISQWPELYPVIYKSDIRGAHTKQFPYSVIYRFDSERIFIFAIFHQRRDPMI